MDCPKYGQVIQIANSTLSLSFFQSFFLIFIFIFYFLIYNNVPIFLFSPFFFAHTSFFCYLILSSSRSNSPSGFLLLSRKILIFRESSHFYCRIGSFLIGGVSIKTVEVSIVPNFFVSLLQQSSLLVWVGGFGVAEAFGVAPMEMKVSIVFRSDQIEGTRSTVFGTSCQSNGGKQSENDAYIPSDGNSHAPKVRKPYTITKQREKWTEEEHQKFLEALKLYGRGWRQIEEHIGTKTAVQIRSHAQKFFSKVVRESDGSAESSIQPINIPPPRPKRKPLHPYPRKSVNSFKGHTISNENEISPSTNMLAAVRDSSSPTSVLSAVGSEAFGSAFSEQNNRCLSPNSCTTDIHSVNLSPVEKENDCMTSKPSEEEEKGSLASVHLSTISNPNMCMKSEFSSKETECVKDAANMTNTTSIKLFGRTVLMVGDQKSLNIDYENVKPITVKSAEMDDAENEKLVQTGESEQVDTQLSLGMCNGNWHIKLGADVINVTSIEPPTASLCLNEYSGDASSLPIWSLYQGLPAFRPCNEILNPMPLRPCSKVRTREEESSCTGSNTESVSDVGNQGKNSDAVESQCHDEEGGATPQKAARGFVPYKRCLAERDGNSLIVALEERKGQRARVCS
ncbi:hypothetical protein RJT34_26021 [Clitoria ternatea]|uniref:Uncharacterized protein n=1 Tax=Clitoria ternatea TaxID=43366 RepID=A0AAN9F665_CLITE